MNPQGAVVIRIDSSSESESSSEIESKSKNKVQLPKEAERINDLGVEFFNSNAFKYSLAAAGFLFFCFNYMVVNKTEYPLVVLTLSAVVGMILYDRSLFKKT